MELLTAKNVSKILRVSLPLIYRMAERKQLKCVRWDCPGNGAEKTRTTVRFKLEDIQEFIERHTVTS